MRHLARPIGHKDEQAAKAAEQRRNDLELMDRVMAGLAVPHIREMRMVETALAREAIGETGATKRGPIDIGKGWTADAWQLPNGDLLRIEAYEEAGPEIALWTPDAPKDNWIYCRTMDALERMRDGDA